MNFDLRTCDSAYYFVLEFLGMSPDNFITEFNIECEDDFDKFWRKNLERIKAVDISDIKVMAFHVTGSLDACAEILSNGLMNLQQVLVNDTLLHQLLDKSGIVFNLKEKNLSCNGKIYDIDYEHYRNHHLLHGIDKKLSQIAHRVFYDFCVNGFLANDHVLNYGTFIHERPEFLMTLGQLFPEAEKLEQYWMDNSKSYRVDFYATLSQVQRFNFELDEDRDPPFEDWIEIDDELKIKKWMLSHAIDRATDGLSEQYLYIKDDVVIPANQIVEISEL